MSCSSPIALLEEKIKEIYAKAESIYHQRFIRPKVQVCKIGRQAAGLACLNHNWIKINYTLFFENVEEFLNDTIIHEIAHLITHKLFPNSPPHGPAWRSVMKNLGAKKICATHNYDTSKIKTKKYKKFVYACKCGKTHLLGKTRHKRFLDGIVYACNQCKTMEFTGKIVT